MKEKTMTKKVYLHPLVVRLWHWMHALCFVVLIVTGIHLRYREIPGLTEFRSSVAIHNLFGFLLLADYALWLLYYLLSGKITIYFPHGGPAKFLRGMIAQIQYYGYGIFIGGPSPFHSSPENKFNAMQLAAYFMVMFFLLPLQIASGVLLWDVKMFAPAISRLGGVRIVDIAHVFLFIATGAFLIIHVYMTTLGRTPLEHIRAMLTGFEERDETPLT